MSEDIRKFSKRIYTLLFLCVFVYVSSKPFVQCFSVNGHSMENTLRPEEDIYVNKFAYPFSTPERFDIIVFHSISAPGKQYVKKIIGLPGENVKIDAKGNIYINNVKLDEHYGKEVIQDPGLAAQEITLGEDEYWCMGDNRNHSSDSRVIGPVPRSRILGKAFIRIYPFSKFGLIHK